MERNDDTTIQKPSLGSALAIAAGFSFYILCMILPLVGPTGSRVPHAAKNKATFLTVLMVTLILAGASAYVAIKRRGESGGRLPYFSIGIGVACILFLVISFFGGFAI
jgi:uncharacterized membrane protein YidH (DUF202 family)